MNTRIIDFTQLEQTYRSKPAAYSDVVVYQKDTGWYYKCVFWDQVVWC